MVDPCSGVCPPIHPARGRERAGADRDGPRGSGHRVADPERSGDNRCLDRSGEQRRLRHHVLRPAPHRQRRDGQGRRQLDGRGRRLELRRPSGHHHRTDEWRQLRRAGAGSQRRRQRLLVGHRLGQGRHGTLGPLPGVCGCRQPSDTHCMVETGQRRRLRHHLLRPALHQERRGRFGRCQLDPQGRLQPVSQLLQYPGPDQRRRVSHAGAGDQRRGRRRLVRTRDQNPQRVSRHALHRHGDS